MIELIYPLEPAPLIGPDAQASEVVPIVDPNGVVIGRASRDYCHGATLAVADPVENAPKSAKSAQNSGAAGENAPKMAKSAQNSGAAGGNAPKSAKSAQNGGVTGGNAPKSAKSAQNAGQAVASESQGSSAPAAPAPLHPVVHLQIVDRYSRFFLQHRSLAKETFPGLWDTAVGGHVTYGELYQEALIREAGEELGFYDFNPQYLDNYIYETDNDREMIGLYVAVGSFDLHPDNYEVSEGRYWPQEEIEANLGKGVFTPEFENEYVLYKDKILALL